MMHFSKVQCPEYQLGGLNGLEAHVLMCAINTAHITKVTKLLFEQHGMDVPKNKVDGILSKFHDIIFRLLEEN